MICPESDRTSAFLDGELDGEAALAAERHIEACAHCQALVSAASQASEALRGSAARLQAPDQLKARIHQALNAEDRVMPAPRPARRAYWWGAASGVGVSAIAASLALLILPMLASQSLTDALADAHVQALMAGRAIAVVSTDHHTVKPWFAGRVPLSPPVADFAPLGFTLVGGRVEAVSGRQAAVVVYRHGLHEIDLYVWRAQGAPPLARAERHGYRLVSWRAGDLDLSAVSDVQSDELDRFVRLVQAERE